MAKEDKHVDLAIYNKGIRVVVGRAIISGDGSIVGQASKDNWQLIKDSFLPTISEISLNQAPSKKPDLKYQGAKDGNS